MPEDDARQGLWRTDEGVPSSGSTPADTRLQWGPTEKPAAPGPQPTTEGQSLWTDEHPSPAARPPSPNGAGSRHPQREAKKTRRRLRRLVTSITILIVLSLVADASYSIYGIAVRLPRASDDLQSARAALSDGDIASARSFLADAAEGAEAASALTGRPAFTLLQATPDGRYVKAVTEAAELATRAGAAGVGAASELGGNAEDIATSLFSGGRIDLQAIAAAQGPVGEAAGYLSEAAASLEGADEPWLDAVSEAAAGAEDQISNAAASLSTADELLSVLPEMFGADETRRYLLAFQALGEARATGGLIGFTGTLEATDGTIELVNVESILDSLPAELDEPVTAPESFETNYGPQSALTQPQQVNTSPNFPVVADVMLEMFESQTGDSYDGMILMDPVALEHMIPATGDITVPGWDEPITAENVVDVMLRDSYLKFTTDEQNLFLSRIIQTFWDRIADGDFDAAALATGLGKATSSQHFRVAATDPDAAKAMATANVDGDYTRFDPNVQLAFNNNYSANKIDYFLRRDIVTTITLERDAAVVNSSITMANNAPKGPPSLLLGPNETYAPNDPPGMNRMLFNVLLPLGAEDIAFGSRSRRDDPVLYEDKGHPVPWQVVEIPAGDQVTVRLSYRLPNPYERDGDGFRFEFTQYPQPAVNADTFSITVSAPEGYGFVTNERGEAEPRARTFLKGTLDIPAVLDLRLIPKKDR